MMRLEPVDLSTVAWPASRLQEAVAALARHCGISTRASATSSPPVGLAQVRESGMDDGIAGWVGTLAETIGLEAEATETPYPEIERLLRGAGPALLRLPGRDEPRFLALLPGGRRIAVLDPELRVRRLQFEAARAALCQPLEAPFATELDGLLGEAGVPKGRLRRARGAMLCQRLGATRIGGCWLLRPKPGASFWLQIRQAGLAHRLLGLLTAHAVQYVFWLLSWWVLGRAALEGRLDRGWLLAWVLLLISVVPFQVIVTWLQGRLAIGAGALLKQRLLAGALRLQPEEIRHQGAGQFLGRVIESEAMESLALTGGFLGLAAVIELALSAAVLGAGAGGILHALLLGGWVMAALALCWRYLQHRRRWTRTRLGLTHDLVEGMVGHRTRLANEDPRNWHEAEDRGLERYVSDSAAMDRTAALVLAFVPRGWLVLGILGLAPAFVSGRGSPAGLAVAIGGILLAYRALRRLAAGVTHLAGAAIAWGQVAPLFDAAARPDVGDAPADALMARRQGESDGRTLLEAHNLGFRYGERRRPVLRGCSLRIERGDRLLLEGASGGGKSTLASLLSGLRVPETGLLLLEGLDRPSLGDHAWRRRVVCAPQFHENHVLTGTFAFNLLMGRGWPPSPQDSSEVEAVCRGLGLGNLLERMPAGLLQMVGETGWQLSHGERSRLYIARALLQNADLVVLDESFAALDPESLQQAMQYVLDRAKTLLVIAHP